MTLEKFKYLEELYKDSFYLDYCLKVTHNKDIAQELLHYCIDQIVSKDVIKINQIINEGKFKYYFCAIVYKSFNSKTSPFHKLYRPKKIDYRDLKQEKYNINIDTKSHITNKLIKEYESENRENKYAKQLFELIMEGYSYRDIQRATGIYFLSAQKAVERFKKEIKKRYENTINSK